MTYVLFKTELLKHLKSKFPSSIVAITEVLKNNSTSYEALTIQTDSPKLCPCIRLQAYYDDYIGTEKYSSFEEVAETIANTVHSLMSSGIQSNIPFDDITNFSIVRDRIILRLINRSMNTDLLTKLVSTDFTDEFVLTYSLVANQNEKELFSIRITLSLMKLWGVPLDELHTIALENTMRLFPVSSFRMGEMISHLFDEPLPTPEAGGDMMYVLSNQIGINGATVLVYPNVLKEFVSKYCMTHNYLYILPSSTHEIILVPSKNLSMTDNLLQMVREVNESQVAKDELLSNNILIYDCSNESLRLIKDGERNAQ